MKILIDNGHGKETSGKRSPDGKLREYAYAREVADLIVALLTSDGYDAELLTPEENDVSLPIRVDRVNKACVKYGASHVLCISIHLNAGAGGWGDYRGWSAYTSKGQTQSDVLADYLYREAMREFPAQTFRMDKSDGDMDKEENFYILKNTKCPCVLTENFFMNGRKDYELLMKKETPARIARLHVRAIKNYLSVHGK